MFLGAISTNEPPKVGDEIYVENEIIGQIVNFYEKDKEFYRILFEIRIEKANLDVMLRDIKIEIDK